MSNYHSPVLLHESLEGLAINADGIYVDATFGGGGHARAILEQLGKNGKLIAFDQDADAVANALPDERFVLVQDNFRFLEKNLALQNAIPVDGILADLGISSHQVNEPARGFSTRYDGPLDMRMNRSAKITAAEILATYDEQSLLKIFREYGEVENAGKLVKTIAEKRKQEELKTVAQLRETIGKCIPRGKENQYLAKVFQALRIEVNGELDALKELLTQSVNVLKPGGRIAVIAYHSLEDRLVKNFFRSGNFSNEEQKDFYGNLVRPLEPVNRKPVTPGENELKKNNRARSAKLRIAQKPALPAEKAAKAV